MTAWSWCLTEQQNVQAGTDRRCPNDGSLVIPPTWGSRAQRWQDGAWTPEKSRPEGHVWNPPAVVEPPKPRQVAARDTTNVLGRRTPTERKRASRAAAAPKVKVTTISARPCAHCRVAFFPRSNHKGGPLQRFCADACRKAAERVRTGSKPRAPMSASGRVCAVCLRDDRPHKGRNLCRTCWNSENRQRQREGIQAKFGPHPAPITCGHPERQHRANGLCASCYVAARRRAARGA